MRLSTFCVVILLLGVLSAQAAVMAAGNTVPRAGTVFLGEQGLDITATGATAGSQIVWYGPGGSPASVPTATLTVDDPAEFYISPVLFGDKTGPWFVIPGNSLAFYVQDPLIEIRVVDETRNFQITNEVTWIPKGDVVGFRIDTNVYEIAKRPGSPGAPVTLRVRGPGGVEYSSLDGYQLEDIMVSGSPFQTGPVWFTGDYESGSYSVWAESTGNDMNLNYKREGKTVTPPVEFLLQSTNPLITPEPTTRPATVLTTLPPTTIPATLPPATVQTQVPATTLTESPGTPPATGTPATTPTSAVPGFGTALSVSALAAGTLILVIRRR
ncbi:MAG: DUF3821 domain-containing protein [Methanoregulaceae archaeon]|nr:DUF3821 domain-containing protein [Methanoregulaceae archaeon]